MKTWKSNDRKPLRVLLVGEEAAAIQLLKFLASSPYRIAGVMASPWRSGSGLAALWPVAEKMGCPVWPSRRVKEAAFAEVLRSAAIDILLNVHSLYIIHEEVLRAPRLGSFNLHPGPLPEYSGLNAVSWALYRGERVYGVTLHKMAPEIDAGPIAYQTSFPIEEEDTALTLYAKCVRHGLPLAAQLLERACDGPEAIPLIEQDLSRRRYFGKEIPGNGAFSWFRPARSIVNFVRACDYFPYRSPWGHPRGHLAGRQIALLKAALTGQSADAAPGTVKRGDGPAVHVACADEWVTVSRVEVEGRACEAADVLSGLDHEFEEPKAAYCECF